MSTLKYIQTFQSTEDKTRKFVYHLLRKEGTFTIEVGVIDKGDGKDILCIPTQTNCHQACRFCHSRELIKKVPSLNLTADEISDIVFTVWEDAGIPTRAERRTLLVSMMGLGEPLANLSGVAGAMKQIERWAFQNRDVRFGLATSMPNANLIDFELLTDLLEYNRIPLKVHLSLHYTEDSERIGWMPGAAPIAMALRKLATYRRRTGNPVEIHYTLIQGVNDTYKHMEQLGDLFDREDRRDMTIKFLHFNPLAGEKVQSSPEEAAQAFRDYLAKRGIKTEFYRSPGQDISACCGAFQGELYNPPNAKISQPSMFGILNAEQSAEVLKHVSVPLGFEVSPELACQLREYRNEVGAAITADNMLAVVDIPTAGDPIGMFSSPWLPDWGTQMCIGDDLFKAADERCNTTATGGILAGFKGSNAH